jgi:hypothetical protein
LWELWLDTNSKDDHVQDLEDFKTIPIWLGTKLVRGFSKIIPLVRCGLKVLVASRATTKCFVLGQ